MVTAAHCLRYLPPAHALPYKEDRTYSNLLGRLHDKKNSVSAVCLFADPIADIAVLGCPDEQDLFEEAEAYHALTDDAPPFPIGKARSEKGWLLALDGAKWIPPKLHLLSGSYGVSLMTGPTEAGMSGSPILNGRNHSPQDLDHQITVSHRRHLLQRLYQRW